jgi:peptide chain release factor 1
MALDMLDKLVGIEQRYEDLNRLFMEVGDDYQRAAELNKERIDLEPIVDLAREYRQVIERIEEARLLLEEEDIELRMLAEAEILDLEPQLTKLEQGIKNMLLLKPCASRNVIAKSELEQAE